MKRLSQVIFFLIFFWHYVNAQTYHLTVSNEPFVFLENAQTAVDEAWSVPEFQIPIGFDFELFDFTSNQFYSYFNSFGGVFELNLDDDHLYMLIPLYSNLLDRGIQQDSALSPITYKTVGPVGQRNFTLELKEAGFYEGLESEYGILLEYISFQVRLYEESGDIEFHYGPYSIQTDAEILWAPFSDPLVGLLGDADWNTHDGYIGEIILLEGNASNPTVVTDTVAFLDWPIPENTVYRFSKTGTSVGEDVSSSTQPLLIPNPTSGDLRLNGNNANDILYPIIVMDVQGRQTCIWNTEAEISAVDLAAGCYYVIAHTKNNVVTEKLLVLPK